MCPFETPASNSNAGNTFGYTLSGPLNPTVTAVAAPMGALYYKTTSPVAVYQKEDNGTSTNWTPLDLTTQAGSLAIPVNVINATSINLGTQLGAAGAVGNYDLYVLGSGGPVVTADPPIINPGISLGQVVTIIGTSDVDTVQFTDTGKAPGDFYTNGNRILGNQQILRMKVIEITGPSLGIYTTIGSVP